MHGAVLVGTGIAPRTIGGSPSMNLLMSSAAMLRGPPIQLWVIAFATTLAQLMYSPVPARVLTYHLPSVVMHPDTAVLSAWVGLWSWCNPRVKSWPLLAVLAQCQALISNISLSLPHWLQFRE